LPLSVKEDTKEKNQYLRSAHFNLGNDKEIHLPEYKSIYVEKECNPTKIDVKLTNEIRNSHMGYMFNPTHQGNVPIFGKSLYQDKLSDIAKIRRSFVPFQHKSLHATTFVLGNAPPTLQSESASKYDNVYIIIIGTSSKSMERLNVM
jgi:hypothetical protein